jgi:hypothetical protein
MKKSITILFCLLTTGLWASDFQMIEDQAAYNLFKSLPGITCTEWNSADFVVYTKYQTKSCDETAKQTDWTCTIQINKKDMAKSPFMSASCTRETN